MSDHYGGARYSEPEYQDQYWDQQYDESQYDVQYYEEQYPTEDYASAPKPGLSKTAKWALIGGGGVVAIAIIVIVAIFLTVVLPNRALEAAVASFNVAVETYTDAQAELATELAAAKTLADNVTVDDVAEATTFESLIAAISKADSLLVSPPPPADSPEAIEVQIATLDAQTRAVKTATTGLVAAIEGVQKDRIALAVANLNKAIPAAQKAYDSYAWLDQADTRVELMTQLDHAFQAVANPSALGDDATAVLSAIEDIIVALKDSADALKAEAEAAKKATYTYLLATDDGQIICGVNLCWELELITVKITLKGTAVTADLTFAKGLGKRTTVAYKGTRQGSSALIKPSKGGDAFQWGVITFSGDEPNAEAVQFTSGENCKKMDGSVGHQDETGKCT